jgi:hypothetical protein
MYAFGVLVVMDASASIHGHVVVSRRPGDVGQPDSASIWISRELPKYAHAAPQGFSFVARVHHWAPRHERQC